MPPTQHANRREPHDRRTIDYAEFASLSSELMRGGGCVRFRAQGNSMLPTIHNGDVLTVENTDPSKLVVGDIVMIRTAAGAVLVHRMIKQGPLSWTTCGDALHGHDAPFTADQLIGVVRTVEHHGKIRRLSNSRGRMMAMGSRYGHTIIGRLFKRLITLRNRPR